MRTKAILLALVIGLAFSAAPALADGASVRGECRDTDGNGGGGSVGADDDGDVDAVNQSEAESIAAGLEVFFTNGGDCPGDTGFIGGGASAAFLSVGFCYDDDGLHDQFPSEDGCPGNALGILP